MLKKIMTATAAAALALSGTAAPAAPAKSNASTPANWSYEIRNGQRVPKATTRVVQADGSWVEETKQGNCVVTRTGRDGEVREVRKCE